HHAFIAAKAYGIPEKTGYGAELASIRTASPGLHRNNPERRPSAPDAPKQRSDCLRNDVELVEIHGFPRNRRIGLQCGFSLLSKLIPGFIDFPELATRRVRNDLGPRFIGFPQGNRVGVSRSATTAE